MEILKILVVENEYYVRKGIIGTFDWEKLECQIVGEAVDGMSGAKMAQEIQPDIIIADIEMPIMNGIEMMQMLRRKEVRSEVIFLTAHRDFTYVHSALKMEAVDYLLKPFRYEDLVHCIQKIRERRKQESKKNEKAVLPEGEEYIAGNEYIKQALIYVREHYMKDTPVTEIAETLGLSEAYFCRLFKKETGYTFGQYMTNYRMHVAAGLLEQFSMKIHEVAEEVGYSDSNYFSLIFKKIMGVSPKEYQYLKKKYEE